MCDPYIHLMHLPLQSRLTSRLIVFVFQAYARIRNNTDALCPSLNVSLNWIFHTIQTSICLDPQQK